MAYLKMSYRDTMKCPKGHKRVIVRSRQTAGKRVRSWCCDCHKSVLVTAGPLPRE